MKTRYLSAFVLMSAVACSEKSSETQSDPAPVAAAAALPAAASPEQKPKRAPITLSSAPADIQKGQETFAAKGCVACHKIGGGKLVGPDLKGVTQRRPQPWIEEMILHPDVMLREDPVARKLLAEHMTPMPNQGVDPEKELPFILSYLKSAE